MPTENLTTYTNYYNGSNYLSPITAPKVIATNLPNGNAAQKNYLYYDFGASYFNGNFSHNFDFNISSLSATDLITLWGLSDDLNDFRGVASDAKNEYAVVIYATTRIALGEIHSGTASFTSDMAFSLNTTYYCTVSFDGTTLKLKVFSDSNRTIQVGSDITRTVTNAPNFRYLYAIQNSTTGSGSATGYIENFDLNPSVIFTLTYTAGANGSITGSSPQTVSQGNDGTQVTAVPNTGYNFSSWSDGVLTASRTDTNVQGNISVTANFVIQTFTLSYTAGAGGTISGSSPQTVNYGANGSQIMAIPNVGFQFVNWSDGLLTFTRTDLNITSNLTVTANFSYLWNYQNKNSSNWTNISKNIATWIFKNK